jgi:uncharacterized iron-regulated membrane protein
MLWAVTPELPSRGGWVLLATPGLPLLLALVCGLTLWRPRRREGFVVLRQQLRADLTLLREAGAR